MRTEHNTDIHLPASSPRPGDPARPFVSIYAMQARLAQEARVKACLKACEGIATEDLQNPNLRLFVGPRGCRTCGTMAATVDGLCEGCREEGR